MKVICRIFLIVVILALCVACCGCADRTVPVPPELAASEVPLPTLSETFRPTDAPVPADTDIPDEMDSVLNAEPGARLCRFVEENSEKHLDYYIFIPENARNYMPLIVFLHGDGQVNDPESLSDYGVISQARAIYGEDYPFISISPCTRQASWIADGIPATLKSLVDHICEEYLIDTDRIVIAGHSRGAIGVWNMINTYGGYFAAAVPVSCGPGPEIQLDAGICAQVPVRGYVGTVGTYESNYARAMQWAAEQIRAAGGTAEVIILDNTDHGGTAEAAFTEDTFKWMLSQKKE